MLTRMRRNGILAIWASSTNNPLSLNHHHCPRCLCTLLITVTNGQHQQRHITVRHHPQQAWHAPTQQKQCNNATSPPSAHKRAPGAHNSATSLSAIWQTTNDDISHRSSSSSQVSLSKKLSQEKLHKVRGQSDMCHTSVNFTPVFPWQQMGGKFSHRLVSRLSYLLYTSMPRIF